MSRTKKLVLLALVLALLVAAGLLFAGQQRKAEAEKAAADAAAAEAQSEKSYAFQIDKQQVEAISWKCLSRSGAVRKSGENWVFTDESGAEQTADTEKINSLLDVISGIESEKKIENPEDLSQFGLDDSICEILVETASEGFKLVFGDATKLNVDVNYFSCGDGCVYTVNGTLCERFYLNNSDLLPQAK